MVIYRVLRSVREGFPICLFWAYVALAAVSLPFIFMFPQLTLLFFALALASLPFAIIGSKLLGFVQRMVASRALSRGACPACGHRMQSQRDAAQVWSCEFCEARFRPDGIEEREETGTARSASLA